MYSFGMTTCNVINYHKTTMYFNPSNYPIKIITSYTVSSVSFVSFCNEKKIDTISFYNSFYIETKVDEKNTSKGDYIFETFDDFSLIDILSVELWSRFKIEEWK